MVEIKIRKQILSLAFTLDAMAEMEKTIPDFTLNDIYKYPRSAGTLADMLYILAKYGEDLAGRQLAMDRKDFGRLSPSPAKIAELQVAVFKALAEGLTMETDDDEDQEQDVVLNELKKKETKDD